jgi:hypothetical protein
MAATITFHANGSDGTESLIDHQASVASGIGFFGDGFGQSVAMDTPQSTTFITDGTGTANTGRQLKNTKYVAQAGAGDNDPGLVQAGDGTTSYQLQNLPNELCPLNIRFENDVSVQTLNPKVIIFDRQSIENSAVGVDTLVYEVRHPLASTSAGRLDLISSDSKASKNKWFEFDSGQSTPDTLVCTPSPGPSGLNTNANDDSANPIFTSEPLVSDTSIVRSDFLQGAGGSFTRHDWFFALSAIPRSIGAKREYALYFSVEFVN